jgi:hypothetical protein
MDNKFWHVICQPFTTPSQATPTIAVSGGTTTSSFHYIPGEQAKAESGVLAGGYLEIQTDVYPNWPIL